MRDVFKELSEWRDLLLLSSPRRMRLPFGQLNRTLCLTAEPFPKSALTL